SDQSHNTWHIYEHTECQDAEPRECQQAEAPSNGGLLCVTIANKRFCKPMCSFGYDFGFMRRSRLFDECSEGTKYQWNSQYVGGNKLAVCNGKRLNSFSGATSAYFPKDCLTTKSNSNLGSSILANFVGELKDAGITGDLKSHCLICG
uniref:Si:ch1073-126c3.2 n=1 Tax=Kryptolebias marmoratus TaxID=37003 RepID=A0A3Q3AWU9_KRYMA